jgi:hypothetical protein
MVHSSRNIDQEACYARKAEADRANGHRSNRTALESGRRKEARAVVSRHTQSSSAAAHTSAPVPELASRLKLSTHETVRLLTNLEERGAVKLSPDHGIEHVRIAAITQAGRDQIAQAA